MTEQQSHLTTGKTSVTNDEKYTRTVDLLQQATTLLQQETTMLSGEHVRDIEPVVNEKNKCFNDFEHWRLFLKTNPIDEQTLSTQQEQNLVKTIEEFNNALRRNQQCLDIALEMTGQLFTVISDNAQRASGQINAYSRYGQKSRLGGRSAAPVSVDQVS